MLALTRRHLLQHSGLTLGAAALALLPDDGGAQTPRPPARAKRVIYLHMIGAPSQLDLFDHKPMLQRWDGRLCPEDFLRGRRFAFLRGHPSLAASRFRFARHGRSGQALSELLPRLGGVADELCVIRSIHTDEFNHAPAQLFLHTGFGRPGRPSFGSWLSYGLGSLSRELPAYVVLASGPLGGAGTSLWSAGFLPSMHQGVQFRGDGDPVLFLSNPPQTSPADRRRVLDAVRALNEAQRATVGDPEIATRIAQYELAYRMQTSLPDLMDIAQESRDTLDLYGAAPGRVSFANNCLLARRLIERGVRVVELYDADWDHHADIATRLPAKCRDVDRPMAALIRDLRQRGLLDDTLVVWGSEFGRTPMQQVDSGTGAATRPGRDHHKEAYTMWLAGGGVRSGLSYGATDEFGYTIAEDPVHIHDLNATILHLLGLNHERLTYRYQGRDYRLTDVHGRVVGELLA